MKSKKQGIKIRYDIAYQPITDEQIGKIAGACQYVDINVLRSNLDEVAEQFIHDHYRQQAFPHAELEECFENIGSAAARLLNALKANDSIVVESVLNVGLGCKLKELKQQVDLLRTIAHDASCVQSAQKTRSKACHSGDAAFNTLFDSLRNIYTANFLKVPSFAMIDGEVGGDFLSFVRETLTVIRGNLSGEVKSSDTSIVASLDKSPSAIRAIHRRRPNQM